MLDDLKLLLGLPLSDSSKDDLLELLIKQATNYARLVTTLTETTPALRVCILKMAVYDYNRLGTEGLNSESYSGTNYSYTDGYPADITALLEQCKANESTGGLIRILW